MAKVFEEQIITSTKKKMEQALEKLKTDKSLQQNFRELTDTIATIEKYDVILNESSSLDKETREKWIEKREKLIDKHNEIYSKIENKGFESRWITTIVKFEREKLEKVLNDAREFAYKKYFGKVDISDIDILDNRWELVGQQIKLAKNNYFKGKS
mgnify:CR=1 FL=1|jgi:hypothetical protein